MLKTVLLILFLLLTVVLAVALAALSRAGAERRASPTIYRRYETPNFTREAGFKLAALPESELLDCRRFWLVNNHTAMVEYRVVPGHDARLYAAESGMLDCPDEPDEEPGAERATRVVDHVSAVLTQAPGRNAHIAWSRDGFDYLLVLERPEMTEAGGLLSAFVRDVRAQRSA